ncbi:MAG: 1-acyl-sn-glycerol-3-phosphate acyltransferase [Desulfobacterales bacterium]|nr:1-acyl-sn-glycerol-3-phosphate acyltransferase [Desulfobacterales bacterium]
MSLLLKFLKSVNDLLTTLLLWAYFLFGYILFFSPFYIVAYFLPKTREQSFQALNHYFYKGFFLWARFLIPRLKITVPDDVLAIRSSVIVCNHLSYLDPILLISLLKRQRTIVKSAFFNVPIFGKVITISGYIPSDNGGDFSSILIDRMDTMKDFLASGGNLFIFPEGTRSRDGSLGEFSKGAFRIARYCKTPIKVLRIKDSNQLFQPGRFLFHTTHKISIEVNLIGDIVPDYESNEGSVSSLIKQVRAIYEKQSGSDLSSKRI